MQQDANTKTLPAWKIYPRKRLAREIEIQLETILESNRTINHASD